MNDTCDVHTVWKNCKWFNMLIGLVDDVSKALSAQAALAAPAATHNLFDALIAALKHDGSALSSATRAFVSAEALRIQQPVVATSASDDDSKVVDSARLYVAQREWAMAEPNAVHWIGSDDATTCLILFLRCAERGLPWIFTRSIAAS